MARAPKWSIAAILAVSALQPSCATPTPSNSFGSITPIANLYSRNLIVCVPTMIGNVIGGAAGLVVISPLVTIEEPKNPWEDDLVLAFLTPPALLLGGVFGTPFLPLAYLAPEDNCDL